LGIESVFPKTLFRVLGIGIKDTVFQTWIVMAILAALAILASRRYRLWEPRRWQLLVEYIVEYVENLIIGTGGRAIPEIVPYLTTMISFIAIANLLGLVPIFQAPTRDLNTTLALSFVSWGSCQYYSVKKRGPVGYLRSFVEPVAFMLPLNLLGDVSRILSMALRLFGNVLAAEIIGAVMFMLVPLLAPLPLNMLGMVTSVLQSLVFTVLTLVFVIDSMGSQEDTSD